MSDFLKKCKAVIPFDAILDDGMNYPSKKFPTVYLLNGLWGNMGDFHNHLGLIKYSEDNGVAFVMASGENSFYVDLPLRHNNYGTFIGRELVEVSRKLLPLRDSRDKK